MDPPSKQSAAGAILYMRREDDILVLLLLQDSGHYKRAPGTRGVVDIGPKGKIESGEDTRTAAVREIKEETGLDVTLDASFSRDLDYSFDEPEAGTGKTLHIRKSVTYYLAEITQDDVEGIRMSDEHLGCKMVEIDDAIKESRYENQKSILRDVAEYLDPSRRSRQGNQE